jgi:hypothetical protein
MVPVNRRQVERALSPNLDEELALILGLMQLIRLEPQPPDQRCKSNDHDQPDYRSPSYMRLRLLDRRSLVGLIVDAIVNRFVVVHGFTV